MGGKQPDLGTFTSIADLRKWITDAKMATAAMMGSGKIEGVEEEDHQVQVRFRHHSFLQLLDGTNGRATFLDA